MWDRTEITSVAAIFTEELYEWGWSEFLESGSAWPHHVGMTGLVAPRPSLAAVGYTDQPGDSMNQLQEGKEVIHRTVPSELVSINNGPRDITAKGPYLPTLSCIVLRPGNLLFTGRRNSKNWTPHPSGWMGHHARVRPNPSAGWARPMGLDRSSELTRCHLIYCFHQLRDRTPSPEDGYIKAQA